MNRDSFHHDCPSQPHSQFVLLRWIRVATDGIGRMLDDHPEAVVFLGSCGLLVGFALGWYGIIWALLAWI